MHQRNRNSRSRSNCNYFVFGMLHVWIVAQRRPS